MRRQGMIINTGAFILPLAALVAMASAAGAADMKIATVKIQVIINESAAGKDAVGKLKVLMDEEGRKMQDKQKELRKLESEFDQQKLIARPEVAEEKEYEIMKLRRDLDSLKNDGSAALRRAQSKASQGIINDVQKIIADYSKQNNISLVLENSMGLSPAGGVVAHADDSIDITGAVIKIYDEKSRKAAPAGR